MSRIRVSLLHFALIVAAVCFPAAASCAESSNTRVLVPVLFATDRGYVSGKKEELGDEQMTHPQLNFGLETIAFDPPGSVDVSNLKRMDWPVIEVAKDSSDMSWRRKMENRPLERAEFLKFITEAQKISPTNEIAIFVHGCCIDHHDAMVSAARVAVWYGMPVVAYDWTSPKMKVSVVTVGGYTPNEENNKDSEDRFADLLDEIEQATDVEKVVIVAHSMGNRLVNAAFKRRFDRLGSKSDLKLFKEVDLASADVPVDVFAARSNNFTRNAKRTCVYVNDSDPALAWSFKVHRKNRLGAPKNDRELLLNREEIFVVDHERITGKVHSAPYWLMSDIYKFSDAGPASGVKLQKQPNHLGIVLPN